MFRCVASPADPFFERTLPGLNMAIDPTTQQAIDATTGKSFAFHHDRSPRVTDVRKEAFHTAMRDEMKLKLAEHGIKEHFLVAGDKLLGDKPEGLHVPVLMNEVSTVQNSRDVIIIVGESGQDCGVFAWRLVRGKQGLERGTAVGVVEAIREFGMGLKAEDEEEDVFANDGPEGRSVPAIIVLNPGQLFYSYRDNCAKTLVSWNDGPRGENMEEFPTAIDEANHLEGHKTAGEHVNTFIEKILPEMINQRTRLYFLAIGDGAQHVLAALDKRIADKTVPPTISSQIEAVALICPHITTPKSDFNLKLLMHLASEAKSWICSDEQLGELLATPILPSDKSTTKEEEVIKPEAAPTVVAIDQWGDVEIQEDDEDGDKKEKWDGEPPIAPTFSAGKKWDGVTETTFEFCMHHVLEFFWMRREQQVEMESMARKLARVKFVEENDAILAADQEENGA